MESLTKENRLFLEASFCDASKRFRSYEDGGQMKNRSFGTGEWLHECWLEEQKANVNVSRVKEWQNVGLYEGFILGAVSGLCLRRPPFSMPENVTNGEMFKVIGK
jgi:hypothetical protein